MARRAPVPDRGLMAPPDPRVGVLFPAGRLGRRRLKCVVERADEHVVDSGTWSAFPGIPCRGGGELAVPLETAFLILI